MSDYEAIRIPCEADPTEYTELIVAQQGLDMSTEDPWVHLLLKRERPGQHPAEVLSVGIADPATLRKLTDVLLDMQIGPDR